MSLISIRGVDVRLGGNAVLARVDVVIERGKIVTMVGPNGASKSTLLRLIIAAVFFALSSATTGLRHIF